MQKFAKRAQDNKKIALARVHALFAQAAIRAAERPDLAARYVTLARKLSTRYRVRMPTVYRRSFCRSCGAYFTPHNMRARAHQHRLIITCFSCKKHMRIPLKPKKKV